MRHCTLCGYETERGTTMRVHRGPKQFVCRSCEESTRANQTIRTIIGFSILGMILLFALAVNIANMNRDEATLDQRSLMDSSTEAQFPPTTNLLEEPAN